MGSNCCALKLRKNSPLAKGGGGGATAVAPPPGSCPNRMRKASLQRVVFEMVPPTSLGLRALLDNPRAYGAAPFSKGEFLATAGSRHSFTAPSPIGLIVSHIFSAGHRGYGDSHGERVFSPRGA